MSYFIVKTRDGIYDFGKRCNSVSYNDPKVCIFKSRDLDPAYETLALIPYDNILMIERREEKDV